MPTLLTCACGHQWYEAPDAPALCPRCGGPPLGLDQHRLLADIPTQPYAPARPGVSPAEAPTVPGDASLPPGAPLRWAVPGYEILAELARGGMGIVYKAVQLNLKRLVALKMMRRREADAEERARFRIEAEAVARLQHPHIVQIHEVGEHDGRPYYCMEFVEGGNLSAWLASGPLPVPQAAHLVEVLARAIWYAHQRHIIHRDLKPANVLLARLTDGPTDGARFPHTPKIADFGLAKKLDEEGQTEPGCVMGTASYMAPEQAEGRTHDIGPLTDVYALGAILYETLTGRPPFRHAIPELTRVQVIHDEPVRPARLRPDLPVEVEAICLKCLEKAPQERYPTALDLAEDLHRFQAGEPLAIRPLSEWEREARWARRAGYEILELVGCTMLGMVYKARQLNLHRLVTLKTISAQARTEPGQLERFQAEAEVAAMLEHPNIVQIYDLGEHDGQLYLSQEFLDGGTLSEKCAGQALPNRQAAQLIELLARAVHHAHQRGIIHTDLRPFNVLLRAPQQSSGVSDSTEADFTQCFGTPRITGFGLARLLEKPGQAPRGLAWRRVFSNYMAPEQVAPTAEAIGPATDIHALGAMLYELLTGQPPFLADTVDETLERIRTAEPVPPTQVQPDASRRLEMICLKCLQKEPAQRYTSAEELAQELHRYWAGNQPPTDEFELIPGYELLEELGVGGAGVVYKARQVSLDRLVALKVFRQRLDRILAANRAVSRLSHPNLVQVHDCGERDGRLFVAEELVSAGSLERKLAGQPQTPAEAARLVETLARAMHYVHEHGIIHRNLKPSVILLTDLGIPKISSFDLARLRDQEPEQDELEGVLRGTPAYMAPEQAAGRVRDIGPATDVYALGEVLYQMLTGQRPFRAEGPLDMLIRVLTEEPAPPRQVRPDIPAALEAICLRCLRKDPAQRYPEAAALADALQAFLASEDAATLQA